MPLFLEPFLKPLSAQEEKSCLDAYQRGDTKARDILVERNLRLVAHVVKKYQGLPDDLDDLISIGTIGLIKAVMTYDSKKGNRLAAYAARCIDNARLSRQRLWIQPSIPRAEKNRDGVFWHRYPRICISFALLWTAA